MIRSLFSTVVTWLRDAISGWDWFWFSPADVRLVCGMRIAVGLVLLYVYGTSFSQALDLIGPSAWIDQQAVGELMQPDEEGFAIVNAWTPSLWHYVSSPQASLSLYGLFLVIIAFYTAGLFTRVSNLLVLIGHISVIHRAFIFHYGVDNVLAMLLLYLLIAPCGARFSVDAWLRRNWRKSSVDSLPTESVGANFALRCIQLHLCVIYLCAGLAKLQGDSWWDGTAVWQVVMSNEIHLLDLRPVAHLGDFAVVTLSLILVVGTLFYECSFALLIWNPKLRPFYLITAVGLHGGIALMMGLLAFGVTMIIACCSFIPLEWIAAWDAKRASDSLESDSDADISPSAALPTP
ncbi:HTTM domain-containing protein [Blastopirellula sp. JC732]|uniref:HTTM domain-containing protein n=1 Tax=Blastopirellula sediminis TaxID=2894196 RepID=A0A9X1SDY7_9BACT|nr:HTTM domain-containing protein [Blastopirellula sediminis]MCC9608017.1 HTTM domain-containing protein [Blastopirellula sediminis]MCC9627190.1 HTTM domain-containing protein [Blastopirellula sediminis]